MTEEITYQNRFRGIMLGTAVGDSLGLPAEGISRRRAKKLFKGRWRHRLGCKMISDDTEHTIFVAQSLLAHPDSPELFAKRLSRSFRWWLVSLPAGVGWATLRAILRLWIGFSPSKSGVFSAGNAPAMRSAPIGAFFAFNPSQLDTYLHISTRITHTDPKALTGAKAVAYLTAFIIRENLTRLSPLDRFIALLRTAGNSDDKEWTELVDQIFEACQQNLSVEQFAERVGLSDGVTGYIYHTVPVVVYAWYRHFGDFEKTLRAVLDCGGDTDTTGAIAGALAGAVVGEQGIPSDWIQGIWEFPRSVNLLRKIADTLALNFPSPTAHTSPITYFLPGVIPRNILFLLVVLLNGFRRLFPPY